MKDLAGIERHRQIEIGCGNFDELHRLDCVVLNAMSITIAKGAVEF